jgi:predicted protein tyrosine phosphatase
MKSRTKMTAQDFLESRNAFSYTPSYQTREQILFLCREMGLSRSAVITYAIAQAHRERVASNKKADLLNATNLD